MSATVTSISRQIDTVESPASPPVVGTEMTRLVTNGLRANTVLNLAVRMMLSLFAFACFVLALRYVVVRGDQMVQILRESGDAGDLIGKRLFVLCMPVLLFAILGGLAAAAAWTLHARGQDETARTLDTLSRLKREDEVAASARGLTHAFEEKLQNARRTLNLLLWLGRALFIICIGLFAAAVINAMANGADLLTIALGGGSLAASVFSVANGIPGKVKAHMADVIQIQTIVTGCDRQISLLESDALVALNNKQFPPRETHELVLEVQRHMSAVVDLAVRQIEEFVDPHEVEG
jgi:hypothetical protein